MQSVHGGSLRRGIMRHQSRGQLRGSLLSIGIDSSATVPHSLIILPESREQNIGAYDLPVDYVRQREQIVSNMTISVIQELAAQYADPDKMVFVVVGDAATQMSRLEELGYGAPIPLGRDGKPIEGGR